jgi:hypothetical protein
MWRRSSNEIHAEANLLLGAWPGDESAFGSWLIRSLKCIGIFLPARVKAESPTQLYQYRDEGRVSTDIYPETHLLVVTQASIGSSKELTMGRLTSTALGEFDDFLTATLIDQVSILLITNSTASKDL